MYKYKSKPNTNISVAWRLVKFGPFGIACVNKEEVAKWLDAISYVEKVLSKKVKAKAKKIEVEAKKEQIKEAPKPAPKKK